MFINSCFYLSGPICKCREQNLQLYVGSGTHLKFICETCYTELYVPWSQFGFQIVCQVPYPGRPKSQYKPPSPEELIKQQAIEEAVSEAVKKKIDN